MNRQLIAVAVAVLGLTFAGTVACGPTTVTGHNCAGDCDKAKVDCNQKCTDDACRTDCDSAFKNCSAQCEDITVQTGLEGDESR